MPEPSSGQLFVWGGVALSDRYGKEPAVFERDRITAEREA
jgi:hypothetical protein